MFFTSSTEQNNIDLKLTLNGKSLYERDSVKFLGGQVDKSLSWKRQINHVVVKLDKANAMFLKLRHVLDKTLRYQSNTQYFDTIFGMLQLFGRKTLIQLKDFIYYRKNTSG